jgi:hypothetical protein
MGNPVAQNQGGQVYYDPQKGQYYTIDQNNSKINNSIFGQLFGGSNGNILPSDRYYLGSSLNDTNGGADWAMNQAKNAVASPYPSVQGLFPLMSLLNTLPTTGLEGGSGAGRFLGSNSLLSPSYANYQANSGNANANTAGKGNDLGS